jgi:hypothetical protein
MTSIEFLFNELWETSKDKLEWHSILEKAKEMHNKEIEISDEEIENDAWERFITDSGRFGFISGAKWYREQLKSKGNGES